VVGLDIIRTATGGGLLADLVGRGEAATKFGTTVLSLSYGRMLGWLDALEKSSKLFCELQRTRRRQNAAAAAAKAGLPAAVQQEDTTEVYLWEDIEAWANGHADFGRWLDSLRNLWLECLLEGESKPGSVEEGEPSPRHTQTRYGYEFVVKKVFNVQLPARGEGDAEQEQVVAKRLQYTNPYAEPLAISLHTDSPSILRLPPNAFRLDAGAGAGADRHAGSSATLPLQFVAPRRRRRARGRREEAAACATVRLFVHNETAGRCEECIQFEVSAA